ncbi:hypothetical protein [Burkholderia ambifaria]|uniref:hypothetical protein n=1 Tax=Burkholderia ambifaria TaxID=152480 RepID=UPI001B9F4AE4|nr:hypothetical protein [Burkholderia ambifaria]MBR8221252.1 hypothetical protein [Burkholderia ambifaria]
MTERPILFSGAMVRAILDGRKTQTRRVIKHQPPGDVSPISVSRYHPTVIDRHGDEEPGEEIFGAYSDDGEWGCKSPFGEPGDWMWVRESGVISKLRGNLEKPGLFRHDVPTTPTIGHYWVEETRAPGASYNVANCSRESALSCYCAKACPSIHMPRWASRITLEITGVRVERLNDCSEDDARAEGSEAIGITFRDDADGTPHLIESLGGPYRDGFRILWERINGAGAWNANPWVWVIQFRRIHGSENR